MSAGDDGWLRLRKKGPTREEVLGQVAEMAIRVGERAVAELDQLKATLHEEFYVCGAAGYPDPYRCDTLDEARRFALDRTYNHSTHKKVEVTIRRRLVSENEVVWTSAPKAKNH